MDAAKKAKIQKAVVGVLLVVFLWSLRRSFVSLGGGSAAPDASSPAVDTQTLSGPLPAVLNRFHERLDAEQQEALHPQDSAAPVETVAYTAGELRDPMTSLLPKPPEPQAVTAGGPGAAGPGMAPPEPPKPPSVTVEGVIWGGVRPQALISGRVYEIGDTIEGARIVAIDEQGVKVAVAGATFSLTTAIRRDPATAWQ